MEVRETKVERGGEAERKDVARESMSRRDHLSPTSPSSYRSVVPECLKCTIKRRSDASQQTVSPHKTKAGKTGKVQRGKDNCADRHRREWARVINSTGCEGNQL